MTDLNVLGIAVGPGANTQAHPLTWAALLGKASTDHNAIERTLDRLRADPGRSAQLLPDLAMMLADHFHCLATGWRSTTDPGLRPWPCEDDRDEVAVIIRYLRDSDPQSRWFERSLEDLALVVSRHIDAEEAALFRNTAAT